MAGWPVSECPVALVSAASLLSPGPVARGTRDGEVDEEWESVPWDLGIGQNRYVRRIFTCAMLEKD